MFLTEGYKNRINELAGIKSNSSVVTLYHGTPRGENFPEKDESYFFSKDKNFAKDYGATIFRCQIDLGKLFDSTNPEHIKKIYDAGFKMTDDYLRDNYVDEDAVIRQYYDFGNDCYPTAESFINCPYAGSDTWEPIEFTDGLVSWIFGNYDSILILEGGVVNYFVGADRILKYEKIK